MQVFTEVMEPFGMPKRRVHSGNCAATVPYCHRERARWRVNGLWKAGVPCLLYGPGGGSESATVPDEYTRISDMHQVAKVLALTALDVCNLPK